MASTRTTPTSPRTVRSIPKGIDDNKHLFSHDLSKLEVTDLTIGGEIILGAGTVGLTLTTTAATPAEVLRFSTLRAGADGDVQRISFRAWDSDNVLQEYAQINAQINDVTPATLDGSIELACMVAGTMTTVFDSNVSAAGVITSTFPVGDVILSDASLTITDADNANTLLVTNNTATTSDVIQFIGSGVFTGTGADAFVNITQSGATTGEAFSVIANGLTSGTVALLSSTGTLVTTGDVLSIVANSATTSTGLVRVSGTGLTDGFAALFTGGGANATATGGVLDIDAGAAVLGSALRVGTTGVYTGATGVVDINAAAATTGDIVVIGGAGLTTGSALRINTTTATLTTGFYLECNDGAASDFTIGDDGATVIAGSAAGTAALTLTAGDLVLTSGDIDSVRRLGIGAVADGSDSLTIAQGTLVAVGEFLNATATWNNAAVVFDGLLFSLTNTASAAGSNIIRFAVGGANQLALTPGGALTIAGALTGTVGNFTAATNQLVLDSDAATTTTLSAAAPAASAVVTIADLGAAWTVVGTTGAQAITGAKTFTSPAFITSPTAVGATWVDLGTVTTADINGGTLDGVTIGGAAAAAITGTAITGTSFVIGANTLTTAEWAFLDGQNQSVFTTSSPTFANLTITSFAANWTNAGRTVTDAGILTTVDINGGSIDGATIGAVATSTIVGTTIDATTDFTIGSLVITSNTLTSTGRLVTAMTVPTVGTGFDGAALALWACKGRIGAAGPVISEFIFDLTNLVNSTTANDIIGESATANCHMGQVTAAVQGTAQAIEIVCLETPAGGDPDIDLYSAVEATGTENALVTDLTETLLFARAASWANGDVRGATVMPAANEYLYLAVGSAGGAPGTYTAGKFKITIYGTA